MQFLSQTDTEPFLGSTNLLAIGTAYKQLQIYDVRADATQRRPIIYTPEWDVNKENLLEHRVTSLCQLDSNKIAVGDSAGFITTLDLRKITNQRGRSLGASIGRFVGPAGSVRQIVKHERLPIISCVGLDRMMRTYDIQSRKELDCVYLKQRLNCMLFCADGTWNSEEDTVGVEETFDNDVVPEGNIDDDDEVVDYVDSSNDELSDGDAAPDDEIEEDSESDEEMDDDTGSDGDSDEEAVSSDQSSSEDVKEKPKAKRRRK
jgi:ribosome biogenesis protein NSA1